MNENLNDLYRDIIMEHYKYPHGKKKLDRADFKSEGKNPVCGDEIEVNLKLDGDIVEDVSVECLGCAISIASGSMLVETIRGKKIEDVKKIAKAVKSVLIGEPLDEDFDLGDIEALEGVRKFPVRIKCALLSWTTLVEGIKDWENNNINKVVTTE